MMPPIGEYTNKTKMLRTYSNIRVHILLTFNIACGHLIAITTNVIDSVPLSTSQRLSHTSSHLLVVTLLTWFKVWKHLGLSKEGVRGALCIGNGYIH